MPLSVLRADSMPLSGDDANAAAAGSGVVTTDDSHGSSGSHTPSDTNGSGSERSQTPTNPTSTGHSSSASPVSALQVEGKPSPPPGLSPRDGANKQQFTYNGRQLQVVPPTAQQQQMQALQQQHMMQQQAQYQMQMQAQYQQQMMQQQGGQRQSRGDRRQMNGNARQYANNGGNLQNPQQAHFYAQSAQQAAAQAAAAAAAAQMGAYHNGHGMSFEMYQQMLFSSGTVDAATLTASIASGQLYQMYQMALANNMAGAFGYAHAQHMQQSDAYAMHMQQQQQQAYYNNNAGADATAVPPQNQPPQSQQQQQPGNYRHTKNAPSTSPLLPSPAAYTDAMYQQQQQQQQAPFYAANGVAVPHSIPSPSRADQQLMQDQHTTNRQFRDQQQQHSERHGNGHHHHHSHSHGHHSHSRSHHRSHSTNDHHEPGSNPRENGYEKSAPQPNTFKTEICRSYQATGSCEYGSSCQFSHGAHELRSREVDSKYKSELCKNFHSTNMQAAMRTAPDGTPLPPVVPSPPPHAPHGAHPAVAPGATGGSCWYGNRCRFLHDEFRLRHSAGEFWLVAPSDRLIRVERVDESNTQRIEQLLDLITSEHNKRQTMLYASTITGATNANAAANTLGTVLNAPVFQQHMALQMQHQLATQGEAQIHVREERAGGASRKEEREREREGKEHHRVEQQQQQQLLQQQQQHGQAIGGDSAVHDALLASAVAARILPLPGTGAHDKMRSVVAITPIMPLNPQPHHAHANVQGGQQQQQPQQGALSGSPTPVQPQAQVQQPSGPMSYARKVATATAAAAVAAPTIMKPAAVRPVVVAPVVATVTSPVTATAPTAAAPVSAQMQAWQTKVSRRDRKARHGESSNSSPIKAALLESVAGADATDAKDHSSASSASTSDFVADDEDLEKIIEKINEVEMMESKERKEAEEKMGAKKEARTAQATPNMD